MNKKELDNYYDLINKYEIYERGVLDKDKDNKLLKLINDMKKIVKK